MKKKYGFMSMPRGGDEINIIKDPIQEDDDLKNRNYGWPKATYGINYSGSQITKNRGKPGDRTYIHIFLGCLVAKKLKGIPRRKVRSSELFHCTVTHFRDFRHP